MGMYSISHKTCTMFCCALLCLVISSLMMGWCDLFIYIYFFHDDTMKWKHFPHHWPSVWGIHRSPVNSPHKGQWHRALMVSLICTWTNSWVNNWDAGDLRCHHAHYDITVMFRNASLSLGQLYHCLNASEITMQDVSIIGFNITKTKQSKMWMVQEVLNMPTGGHSI